jgi:hypothetical protein
MKRPWYRLKRFERRAIGNTLSLSTVTGTVALRSGS